jgi:hypothetical protein
MKSICQLFWYQSTLKDLWEMPLEILFYQILDDISSWKITEDFVTLKTSS